MKKLVVFLFALVLILGAMSSAHADKPDNKKSETAPVKSLVVMDDGIATYLFYVVKIAPTQCVLLTVKGKQFEVTTLPKCPK